MAIEEVLECRCALDIVVRTDVSKAIYENLEECRSWWGYWVVKQSFDEGEGGGVALRGSGICWVVSSVRSLDLARMHNLEEQSSPRCMNFRRYQALMQVFVRNLCLWNLLIGWGMRVRSCRGSGTEVKENHLLH